MSKQNRNRKSGNANKPAPNRPTKKRHANQIRGKKRQTLANRPSQQWRLNRTGPVNNRLANRSVSNRLGNRPVNNRPNRPVNNRPVNRPVNNRPGNRPVNNRPVNRPVNKRPQPAPQLGKLQTIENNLRLIKNKQTSFKKAQIRYYQTGAQQNATQPTKRPLRAKVQATHTDRKPIHARLGANRALKPVQTKRLKQTVQTRIDTRRKASNARQQHPTAPSSYTVVVPNASNNLPRHTVELDPQIQREISMIQNRSRVTNATSYVLEANGSLANGMRGQVIQPQTVHVPFTKRLMTLNERFSQL